MAVFRLIGLWLLALAFVTLVIDGTKSIASSSWVITSLGETWASLHLASLNQLQAGIQRNLSPSLWDVIIVPILQTPTWIVLAVIAVLFTLIGRKRSSVKVIVNQD